MARALPAQRSVAPACDCRRGWTARWPSSRRSRSRSPCSRSSSGRRCPWWLSWRMPW